MHSNYPRRLLAVLAVAISLTPLAASAGTIDDLDLVGTYGSGSQRAALVLDFGGTSYAFAWKYDGALSGYDLLSNIQNANGDFSFDATNWGFGYSVDALYYHDGATNYTMGGDISQPGEWLASFSSADGGASWTELADGASDYLVPNGSLYGWILAPASTWEIIGGEWVRTSPPPAPPEAPLSGVPEPATWLLLASLAVVVVPRAAWRRRRAQVG